MGGRAENKSMKDTHNLRRASFRELHEMLETEKSIGVDGFLESEELSQRDPQDSSASTL